MESSRSAMAILKIDHQIFNLKTGIHLIGSDKGLEVYINSKTIDEKHALLEVSSYGMKMIDLHTKNCTFINGIKIDCVKSIELPKTCSIQFGYVTGDLKWYGENDSGFSEKVDTSDIIVSSPDRNEETHTFYINNKNKKKITSTPNIDMKFKTECMSPPSIKSPNENAKRNEKSFSNLNTHDSIKENKQTNGSSFFVPETQPFVTNHNLSRLSKSHCNDSINGNNSSFFIPETQPITQNKTNICTNISYENIRQNIENMSENDEFYIPETQEIFQDNNSLNSQCVGGSLYKISTQDFNATAVGHGLLDASSDLSNDSENLFNGVQLSVNIPFIKTTDINTTKPSFDKLTSNNINNSTTDCCEDDYDAEMSALKWNETERKTNSATVSNSTTPDFIQDNTKILKDNKILEKIREDSVTPDFIIEKNTPLQNNKTLERIRADSITPDFILEKNTTLQNNKTEEIWEDSITPDFILEINNKLNNRETNSVTPDSILDGEFCDINKKQESKAENSFKEIYKQNICDEHQLEPTQVFIKPIQRNVNNKSIRTSIQLQSNTDYLEPTQIYMKPVKPNNLMKSNDEDLEPTQIFSKHISLSNHSDKENTIDSNKGNESNLDKNSDSTQLFISHKRKSINNKKQSCSTENSDLLEPTQPFIREKINHVPEKSAILNFTLESDDDENWPHKRNLNNRNKQNKLISSSDEERDFEQDSKFKTPIGSGIKKINSNCSSDASFSNLKKINSLSSNSSTDLNKQCDNNKSNDSNSQNNFDFITCTPQFDFIKPHQSLDIKQAGHIFNNVKSKNNKILLEESSDDDDFDNLLNLLDNKDNEKPKSATKVKKSRKKESKDTNNKSTKGNNLLPERETRAKRRKVNFKDQSTSEIRKSTRKKTLPNYIIESYITDNFTEEFSSDFDEVKSITRTTNKRSHKRNIEDDETKSSKIKKTTSQPSNSDRKKLQKKLIANERDNSETSLESNEHNEKGRVTRRNKKSNHKFVFTLVNSADYYSIIESMGAEIVENPKDATILITNGIFRTCKFMVALARGIPIVSNKWLDIITNSPDTSYKNYIINDPVNEKKFKFSLTETLKSAKKLIFKNYTFLITPKTTPPPSELIQIIECTGGQYVKEIPKGLIDINKFYVVSDKKDNKLWPKIRKSIPNVNIISTEGILLSVMQHSLRFNEHLLLQKN